MTSRSLNLSLSIAVRRASTLAVLSAATISLWGQGFTTCGSNICSSPTTADVGIGTTTPVYPLEVVNPGGQGVQTIVGYAAGGGVVALRSAQGSLASPGSSLSGDLLGHVAYQGYFNSGFYPGARIRGWASQNWTSAGTGTYLTFETTTNSTTTPLERVRIDNAGNVGIGTTSPQHLLQVAGVIGAEEVIVSSTGADYVFQPGYQLKPLAEVGEYIKRYRHLPDIPSAMEVQKQGLSLGEMQSKLLAKVEELTLHMIQAEQSSQRLDAENRELRERVARLESREGNHGQKDRLP